MRNLVVVIEYKGDSTDRRYQHWSQPFVPPDGEIEELLLRRYREPLVPIKGIPSDASFAVVADVKECGADTKHPTWLTPDDGDAYSPTTPQFTMARCSSSSRLYPRYSGSYRTLVLFAGFSESNRLTKTDSLSAGGRFVFASDPRFSPLFSLR